MRKMRLVVVAIISTLVYCISLSTAMAKDEAVKIRDAAKVFKDIAAIKKWKIPPELLKSASAVVIIPGATKRSFMVNGGQANGVLLVHDNEGAWSKPVFITLTGGTLGWQIVGDPMDIILVYKTMKNVDPLMKGKIVLDSKVALESGWLGPDMKAASSKQLKADIASYVRSHGNFSEDTTVSSATIQIDAVANETFYAKPKVTAAEIVSGNEQKATEDVKTLQKVLTDYAAIKQQNTGKNKDVPKH